MNKQNRIEELEYVLDMYKETKLILDVWDKDDLNNRINKIEQELQELNSQIKPNRKGCGIRIFEGGDGETIGVCGEEGMYCFGCHKLKEKKE